MFKSKKQNVTTNTPQDAFKDTQSKNIPHADPLLILPNETSTTITDKKSSVGATLSSRMRLPFFKEKTLSTELQTLHNEEVRKKFEVAFTRLHGEFSRREQQLETRLHDIQTQHEVLMFQKRNRLRWMIPLGLAVAFAGGYMLFVLTNMQNAMSSMTGSIHNMNGYMENMSSNTETMSNDMHIMNNSMQQMNGNVKGMSDSITPMGEMAKDVSPLTQPLKTFRSFMPF